MPYIRTENPSGVPSGQIYRIGDPYPPQGEEFLANVTNKATGKCIARNGGYSDGSEAPGADIYQWSCTDGDLSHMLAMIPVKDGWLIRSSVRINLCLQAHGTPSDNQGFQACDAGDDRQQWILQHVMQGTRALEVLVIKNRNTGMCLAHLGPDDGNIVILQRPCVSEVSTEWSINRLPPIGAKDCGNQRASFEVRNHETGLYVGDGDRPRIRGEASAMSLVPVGQSAHGCTVQIIGPLGRLHGDLG